MRIDHVKLSALFAPLALGLAACNMGPSDSSGTDGAADTKSRASTATDGADTMAANDPAPGETVRAEIADSEDRPTMQLQVVLDRLGFTPGVVDGQMGISTRNAIAGFQEANDLDVTGTLDDKTRQALAHWDNIPATRVVTIPASFAQGSFTAIPENPADQSKMERLGYTSLEEKLAERFHTTVETLAMLNPGGRPAGAGANGSDRAMPVSAPTGSPSAGPTDTSRKDAPRIAFRAGQQIRVPNVGRDRIDPSTVDDQDWLSTLRTLGIGTDQPEAARVVVSKSEGTLKAYDKNGKLVAMFTATMGSEHDPLPLGDWKILGVAHNPPFQYNPELFWDVPDDQAKQTLPPGPNGPVGVVWIDLSKEHYGIHGTPEPQTIGRAQSHGCIRLTNWDAARLAQMVSPGTRALFEA